MSNQQTTSAVRRDFDNRVQHLPEQFQERLSRFERNNPDFDDYRSYELNICEVSYALIQHYKDNDRRSVINFGTLPLEEQKQIVALCTVPFEMLSVNQIDCAVRLAWLYFNYPDHIDKEHAGMCYLLGCVLCGCYASELK